ncbi:MAG TPA: hypothetical protein VJA25_04900, partial [Dehalococcoidia bacterium]|nr:hypothetical protein [Dehalococcoidia bacterium]
MPYDIAINSKQYTAERWETAQQGQLLRQEWEGGWLGGMGAWDLRDPRRYYVCDGFDASQHPYLRLRPRFTHNLTVAAFDLDKPVHKFVASAGGTNYMFVLNDRRSIQVNLTTLAIGVTTDFGAGAVCGRPALFGGEWYVGLGATVNAKKLTNVALNTWTDVGSPAVTALQFATRMQGATPQLVR